MKKSMLLLCVFVSSVSIYGQEWTTGSGLIYSNNNKVSIGANSVQGTYGTNESVFQLVAPSSNSAFLALKSGTKGLTFGTGPYGNGLYISENDPFNFSYGANIVFNINPNGNIGIGTTSPKAKLEVKRGGTIGGTWNPSGSFFTVSDTGNSSMIMDSNEIYGSGTLHVGSKTGDIIKFRTIQDTGAASDKMVIKADGKVGIGTNAPDAKLTVKGNIHAEEVKIDLSVPAPDYVFTKDYNLLTIEEVQQHIAAQGHLPNIPSATEMEANGVELGLMNMKLLEKIEELTLYTISQEEQLDSLQHQIDKLERDNKKLRSSDSELQTLKNKNKELESRLVKIEEVLVKE